MDITLLPIKNLSNGVSLGGFDLDTLPCITSASTRTVSSNLELFWDTVTEQVSLIKNLPDNIIINIDDGQRFIPQIVRKNIFIKSDIIYVQLTHNNILTLFEKDEYSMLDKDGYDLSGKDIANSELQRYFYFTK